MKSKEVLCFATGIFTIVLFSKYVYNNYFKKKDEKIGFVDTETYYSYSASESEISCDTEMDTNSDNDDIYIESITDIKNTEEMYSVPLTDSESEQYNSEYYDETSEAE